MDSTRTRDRHNGDPGRPISALPPPTSACPETRPFGLARSFKPPPSRRSTAHSATDDQDHKLRDRFASLSASSPARRALLEKSSLAAWRALNLDLALRRACSSGERRCKPWSRRPNLGVLHVSVRWSNCHFKGRSGPPDNFCDNLIFLQWVICSASLGSGTRPSCIVCVHLTPIPTLAMQAGGAKRGERARLALDVTGPAHWPRLQL